MNEPVGLWTLLIIVATIATSYFGFRSREFEGKYIFHPQRILAHKEFYRVVTSAFLHADGSHLFVNMLSLYLFGGVIESALGSAGFLAVYFGAIVGGSLLALWVHRHHDYRAYGASGGVCGVVFAYILYFPQGGIGMFFIPIYIPAWLYGIAYLLYSFIGMKTHRGDVGHDAHLGGALVGFLLAGALRPWAVEAHWKLFLVMLGATIALLCYLWFNPLFLPLLSFLGRGRAKRRETPTHRWEPREVDAILEKIGRSGIESLDEEEKKLLAEVSDKYRRRADSQKPESGLTI